jgi:hypothetical protein
MHRILHYLRCQYFHNDWYLNYHKIISINYMTCRTDSWHSRSVAVLSPRRTGFDATQSAWRSGEPGRPSAPEPRFAPASTFPLTAHIPPSVTKATRPVRPTPLNNISEDNDRPRQPASCLQYAAFGPWRRHTSHTTAEGWSYQMLCLGSPQFSRLSPI